jgi:hypothetical protein
MVSWISSHSSWQSGNTCYRLRRYRKHCTSRRQLFFLWPYPAWRIAGRTWCYPSCYPLCRPRLGNEKRSLELGRFHYGFFFSCFAPPPSDVRINHQRLPRRCVYRATSSMTSRGQILFWPNFQYPHPPSSFHHFSISRRRNPVGFLPEVWSPLQATVHLCGVFYLPWHWRSGTKEHGF